ncbi:MAG: universal stress protein [Thermoleophilia bacterium]
MNGYRNLLVTADGPQEALREGLRVAGQENCWVTVLKVVPSYEGEIDLTGVRDIRKVLTSDRDGEWRTWHKNLYGEPAARVRVEQGELQDTINRVAAEEGCDLIIMGVKKRAGFIRNLFAGNLVHKVARRAPCPVMVVDA